MNLAPPPPHEIPPPPPASPAGEQELLAHVAAENGMAFLFASRDEARVAAVIFRLWAAPCALEALYRAKPELVSAWWAGPFAGLEPVRLFEARVRQSWYLAGWKRWALSIRFLQRIDHPVLFAPGEGHCDFVAPMTGLQTTAQELRHYPLTRECDAPVCTCRFFPVEDPA